MVQPVACHTPSLPPAADALPAAGLLEVPQAAALATVASCHARAVAPARDRLFVSSAASASAQPAHTTVATPPKTTGAGYASTVASAVSTVVKAAAGKAKTTKKKSGGALAFLDDRSLSTDEKLMRLLVYLESKWQKDIEKRMKELAATGAAKKASSSSSSRSGGGGVLGTVVRSVTSFVPGADMALSLLENPQARQLISQASGPVLAAGVSACGFPQLAPAALKLGPTAVDALASASKAAKTGGGSSSGSSSSSSDLSPDAFEKIQLMELQRVVDHQKELFSMVSNMLRAENDLRMTIIQNVR